MRFRERHGMRLSLEAGVERCRELGDLLSAYHDGELDEELRATVEAHIKTCKQCRQTEEDLKKVGALVAGLVPIIPSPDWIVKVFDQIGIDTVPSGAGQGPPQAGSGSPPGGGAGGMGGGGASPGLANMMSGWGWMMKMGAFLMASTIIIGSLVLTSLILSPDLPAPPAPLPPDSSESEDTSTPNPVPDIPGTDDPDSSTASATMEQTGTATTTVTLGPAMAIGEVNCKCRFGPAMEYEVVSYLYEGQSAPIDGRNEDWTWWWIQKQDGVGHCWVYDGLVTVMGDTSNVQLILAPPTSTPEDTTSPTVSINYSPTGYRRPDSEDVITFTAQAQDNGQIDYIEIWARTSSENIASKIATCQDTTSCVFSAGPYSSSYVYVYARAYDTGGNMGQSSQLTIQIHTVIY
jgi:hypothetical protein